MVDEFMAHGYTYFDTAYSYGDGANEIAVDAFLHEKIPFGAIARLVEETMQAVPVIAHPTLEQVFECDRAARQKAAALLARFGA